MFFCSNQNPRFTKCKSIYISALENLAPEGDRPNTTIKEGFPARQIDHNNFAVQK